MLEVGTVNIRLYVVTALVVLDAILLATGSMTALSAVLTIVLVCYGLVQVVKTALLWRLRNRLMVTYIFVGGVPILLILALTFCGAWIVVGQVATYLVNSEIHRRALVMENPARYLAQAPASVRGAIVNEMAPILKDRVPGFQILVTGDQQTFRFPPDNKLEPPPAGWNKFAGVVHKGGRYYCMALARNGPVQALLMAPLNQRVLESLVPGIGGITLQEFRDGPVFSRESFGGSVPPPYDFLDREFVWFNTLNAAEWNSPQADGLALLYVNTRTSAVLNVVFADSADAPQYAMTGFLVIVSLLAAVELISVFIWVNMTRRITGSVQNLYDGTLRISEGSFSNRIPVQGKDQLADLSGSFNKMASELENLLVVAKEKERLQSELTIASEVQNQLFPRAAPPMRTIQLTGTCNPARTVSGDYYDYVCLPDGNLAVAIGDVAGKGISAALLMASIQSIMRTQLAATLPMSAVAGNGSQRSHFSTASMMAQMNRQLYANTSPEKYATLFLGMYDENSRILTYTNAGHLPPLLLCGGSVKTLEVTGTVVGLFPSILYEEQTIRLCPGDVLVAYTDGITEPENAYGEEYGIERLTESLLRYQHCEPGEMVAKVMEAVEHWSSTPELPDDMTVLVARGIA